MPCKKYFITATGTGIGKTFVTSALSLRLRGQGKKVVALKPVISGFDTAKIEDSDTGILLKSQGLPISLANARLVSPWQFPDPISPDMAAENKNTHIDFAELISFCKKNEGADYLFIEGVGGVMTPICHNRTVLDWMEELGYEIIIVAGSYLGTISHTLTACQAVTGRDLKIRSIIISESEISPVPSPRTILTLKRFLPNNVPLYCIKRNDYEQSIIEIEL